MTISDRVLLLIVTVACSACAQCSSAWCVETTTLLPVKVSTRDDLRQAVEATVSSCRGLIDLRLKAARSSDGVMQARPSTWWVTATHSLRYHAHHYTRGQSHLYQSRFKSFPVQDDSYSYTVCPCGQNTQTNILAIENRVYAVDVV